MKINDKRVGVDGDSFEERMANVEKLEPSLLPEPVPTFDYIDGDSIADHFDHNPRGTLAAMEKFISPEAAIRWDIDVVNTEASTDWGGKQTPPMLRFIKKLGFWRAFGGVPSPQDFGESESKVFIAQWEPDVDADASGIPGRWLARNSMLTPVACTLEIEEPIGVFRVVKVVALHDKDSRYLAAQRAIWSEDNHDASTRRIVAVRDCDTGNSVVYERIGFERRLKATTSYSWHDDLDMRADRT
jgi:hypothetical protein